MAPTFSLIKIIIQSLHSDERWSQQLRQQSGLLQMETTVHEIPDKHTSTGGCWNGDNGVMIML